MWESIVLATSFGRRQLKKQFCASFALARFHTAWVDSVEKSPFWPTKPAPAQNQPQTQTDGLKQ
jgi:hypothetical protein